MNISDSIDAGALLRRHGFRPRHRLGQNFLQDMPVMRRIATAARIEKSDAVLEIGCGFGALTRQLAEAAGRVVAVEVDRRLIAIARIYLKDLENVELVAGDILELTPEGMGLPARYIVAANIPYYVTSPILRHLLESRPAPRRIVLTVQQEVAERICSNPPRMSLLALSVQAYGHTEIVDYISAAAFYPAPKVDSAVVRVEIPAEPRVPAALLGAIFRLARAAFGQKRKTLRNALAAGLKIPPAAAAGLLTQADIDPGRRAETLGLEDWVRLAKAEEVRTGNSG